MADNSIIFSYEIDNTKAIAALEQADKALLNFTANLEKLNKKMNEGQTQTANNIDNTNAAIKEQTGLIEKLRAKESDLRKSRDSAKDIETLRKYNNELQKTQTQLKNLETQGRSAFGGLLESAKATFAGMAAFNIVEAGLRGIADILKTGFNAATNQEQFLISAEVMLGSAEAAKTLNKELTDLAARTPFESSDLQNATKVLLGFGVENDKILPTLKALGDVSGGNSEKLNSLALAFGQVKAAGRLMGQEVLQMINAGFNPLQEISRNTGKSMAQLKKEMESGLIGFDQVEKAFISVTAQGGKFFNMMERQSTTTAGKLSTLKDNFVILLRDGVNLLLPAINSFIDFLSSLIVTISTFAGILAKLPKFMKENAGLFILMGGALLTLNLNLVTVTASMIAMQFRQMALIVQTRALNGLLAITNALGNLNPFGLMVTGITAAATALLYYNRVQKDSNELRGQAMEQVAKELTTLDELVLVATSAASSTEERANAIREINSLYGSYIPFLLDEKSSLIEIKEAQDEATRALINNTLEKMKAMQLQDNLEKQLKSQMELMNQLRTSNNLGDAEKEQLGNSIRRQKELAFEIAQQEELAQKINRTMQQYEDSYDTAKKVDKEKADVHLKRSNELRTEFLEMQKQQKDVGLLKKEFNDLSKEQFKTIAGYDAQSGFLEENYAKIKLLFNGEKLAILENLKINHDAMLQRGADIRSYTVAFDGLTEKEKKQTKEILTNAGAGGIRAKAFKYELDLIEADTKAIENNTEKLNDQTEALIRQKAVRDANLTSLSTEILQLETETDIAKREADQRREIANKSLLDQFNKQKERLDKEREQAKERLKDVRISEKERADLIVFTTTTYNEKILELNANFNRENQQITELSQLEQISILENAYQKRVKIISDFITIQNQLIKENKATLAQMEFEFTQTVLNNDLATFQARYDALRLARSRELDVENETRLKLIEKQIQINKELTLAIAKGENDKANALIIANKAVQSEIEISKQKEIEIEMKAIRLKHEINKAALEDKIKQEQEYQQRIADTVSGIRGNIGAQGGAAGDIGARSLDLLIKANQLRERYEETAAAKRLALERKNVEDILAERKRLGDTTSIIYKDAQKKQEQLEIEDLARKKEFERKKFENTVDAAVATVKIITDTINAVTQVQIEQVNRLIAAQEKRVADAEKLAEKGNATQLKLEKERLAQLTKEREKFVRRQQALATIELIANSLAAIAKSANLPPPLNIIAIASTVAALGAGLFAAKAKGQAAASGFKKGGYTGDVSENQEVGPVHGREYVFDAQSTKRIGVKNLEMLHKGRAPLKESVYGMRSTNQIIQQYQIINKTDNSGIEKRLENLEETLKDLPKYMPQTKVVGDISQMVKVIEQRSYTTKRITKN